MGIGTGIFFTVVGAVLLWAIDIDVPYIDGDALGLILMAAGIAVLIVAVILKTNVPAAGIGTGITLIAAGAVLAMAIEVDVPYIDDDAMGLILIVAGLIALVMTIGVNLQQRRQTQQYYQSQQYYQGNPGQFGQSTPRQGQQAPPQQGQQGQQSPHQGPPPGYYQQYRN